MSRERSLLAARPGKALKPAVPPARATPSRPKTQRPENAEPSPAITLAHLSEGDKQKVARLVEKLVALGQEHDNALRTIQTERDHHEEAMRNMASSIEGQFLIIEDQLRIKDEMINSLQTKEAMLTSMLALYQGKMKNMSEMVLIANNSQKQFVLRQKDLENSIEHLTAVTETQRRVIEGLEQSLRSLRTAYDQSAKEMLESVSQERNRRVAAEEKLKVFEQRPVADVLTPSAHHGDCHNAALHENSNKGASSGGSSSSGGGGSSSSSSSSSSTRGGNPPSPQPTPQPSPSRDEYTHYSLMYNSSQEEINISGLGIGGGGYETYGTAVATVVDYSPGRPQPLASLAVKPALRSHEAEAPPQPPPKPLGLPPSAWTPAPPTDPEPARCGIAILSPEPTVQPTSLRAVHGEDPSAVATGDEPVEPAGPARRLQERKTVARIPAVHSTPVVHIGESSHGAEADGIPSRPRREEDQTSKAKGSARQKETGRDKGKEKHRDKEASFPPEGKERKKNKPQGEGIVRQRQEYDASLFDLVQQLNS